MRIGKSVLFLFLCLTVLVAPSAAAVDGFIRYERLGERVLVLTEISPMENIVVALLTSEGIVVFDATGSRETAEAMREIMIREFGRDDFAYLVNTHHHWDHTFGNQVFSDAVGVGYEEVPARMALDAARIPTRIENMERRLSQLRAERDTLPAGSAEAETLAGHIAFDERYFRGMADGFASTPPKITFRDRMTLRVGDRTVEMVFFGPAHSGTDILIRVPEEGILMTGDLFLERGWLPLFCGTRKLDVPRWIEALDWALDEEGGVRTVIPGHRDVWPREKLVFWRNYIVDLWEGIRAADAEGLDIDALAARFPRSARLDYLKAIGHDDTELTHFQQENVIGFWKQLRESAAEVVGAAFDEGGIERGRAVFADLREEGRAFFDENEFNDLGYRLLQEQRVDEAIVVFTSNAEAFPESWNAWDSLAEGYMTRGDSAAAIRHYRRSIEIYPENENGREKLRELGVAP
ncbi:MAG: MBL fold metallo-hydrolase [Candidatus Eisenbacteria bacterium]|nr:MBL fold metallo-hydrolase [Candidatus Eisenbacteria bacterium]